MNIQTNRLDRGFYQHQEEFEEAALRVLRSGWYIMGKELSEFEEEFSSYVGARYCVGLGNGLDALWLAFRVLGIGKGDEVIVQGNTYIASVMGITINGATPVFVEPDEYFNIDADKIEEKITERTKAVLVVHLYGQASQMDKICDICKRHKLRLVEDCAQSHGSAYKGRVTGTFGDIGCFSFYPSKNIGAFGDGGAIVTDDEEIARMMRIYRNYGSEKRYYNMVVGTNSRLDEIQAALLKVRLKYALESNREKQDIAAVYDERIHNPKIILPGVREGADHIYHQYVIRCKERDALMSYLRDNGISTIIHYPIPPHLAEAYEYLGHKKGYLPITEEYADTVLSIPMFNGMTGEEIDYTVEVLNKFE
ncbi:MAG: DegT/DnrJ/EryC1/StrS family aminotransferase [Lachnospiraceae bacterium]|nr:DegT/DnrJ/EryC1/StrS family aminotransferase [Lachnospiraceae bacterium]